MRFFLTTLSVCMALLSTVAMAETKDCAQVFIKNASYMHCPADGSFYKAISEKDKTPNCTYDSSSLRVASCSTKKCEYDLCIGYVTCGNSKPKGSKKRVACAAINGACPANPDDCIADKSVIIDKATYLKEGTINGGQNSNRANVSGE